MPASCNTVSKSRYKILKWFPPCICIFCLPLTLLLPFSFQSRKKLKIVVQIIFTLVKPQKALFMRRRWCEIMWWRYFMLVTITICSVITRKMNFRGRISEESLRVKLYSCAAKLEWYLFCEVSVSPEIILKGCGWNVPIF